MLAVELGVMRTPFPLPPRAMFRSSLPLAAALMFSRSTLCAQRVAFGAEIGPERWVQGGPSKVGLAYTAHLGLQGKYGSGGVLYSDWRISFASGTSHMPVIGGWYERRLGPKERLRPV